jgi:hypothetical protein
MGYLVASPSFETQVAAATEAFRGLDVTEVQESHLEGVVSGVTIERTPEQAVAVADGDDGGEERTNKTTVLVTVRS